MIRELKEADVKAIGGLSEEDRAIRGIYELVDFAVPVIRDFREAVGRGVGIKDWWRNVRKAVGGLREANSEVALGFLLRKGVQTVANDWYTVADRKWQDYAMTVGSTGFAEWYAPLYGSELAELVDRGGKFKEGRISGEDSHMINQKFGRIESFERELFDDDQTGQVKQRAQRLGASMAVTESVWASYKFIGSARTYATLTVPASIYATTDYNGTAVSSPWSSTLYSSAAGNRLGTYHELNMGFLKEAYTTLLNATDPLSNKIIVNPNCMLVSSNDAINGQLLLSPGGYPAVMGQSNTAAASAPIVGGTTSAAGANQGVLAGFPGGFASPNPFAGLGIKLVVERYLPAWAWAFGEKGKGFVFQERDPLEVIQENPQSGAGFENDAYRFRSRRRFEADWVGGGSRFWFLGNDGTATGQQ